MPADTLRRDRLDILTTSRRQFLTIGGTAAALALTTRLPSADTPTTSTARLDYPFTLGVASGDPLPDSVVLWTRLAPEPLESLGGMPYRDERVLWEVATDRRFSHVVRRGVARARVAYAHTVHVDVRGLEPNRVYFYRFRHRREISPVGRTKTAPSPGTHVNQLAFAFASCQAWFDGYYTAYQHMAEEDLDFVIHLGDYLYEYGIGAQGGERRVPVPHQLRQPCDTLDRYRIQYGLYKSDPDLQAAHAAFPFIATWDDHEVENNWAGDISQGNDPVTEFLVQRANGFRAYWEHMPLRPPREPRGPDMALYRRFTYGGLATFNVLDSRQYRSDQACGDGLKEPCDELYDPTRTLLGGEQERWLFDGLGDSSAAWNVLAQQMVMTDADRDPGEGERLPMDNWNGYLPVRQRLFDEIMERGVDNVVVLSGDAHCSMTTDLKADFDDIDSPTVGVEFLGTSISSGRDGQDMDNRGEQWLAANPHMKYYNQRRGYVRCLVTNERWRSDYRVLPYVTSPGAPITTHASFVVENGVPGIQRA